MTVRSSSAKSRASVPCQRLCAAPPLANRSKHSHEHASCKSVTLDLATMSQLRNPDDIPVVSDDAEVRVRFAPSPTGTPHVGLIRTALFNWGWSRLTRRKMIFRVEDTDQKRDAEESYQQLLDAMVRMCIDRDRSE